MREEGFCDRHGPYDASQGGCPYCAQEGGLPPAPTPLDDELPTDPWGGHGRSAPRPYEYEEEETDFGFRARLAEEDEEATQWPEARRPDWDEDKDREWAVDRGGQYLGRLRDRDQLSRG